MTKSKIPHVPGPRQVVIPDGLPLRELPIYRLALFRAHPGPANPNKRGDGYYIAAGPSDIQRDLGVPRDQLFYRFWTDQPAAEWRDPATDAVMGRGNYSPAVPIASSMRWVPPAGAQGRVAFILHVYIVRNYVAVAEVSWINVGPPGHAPRDWYGPPETWGHRPSWNPSLLVAVHGWQPLPPRKQ